MSDVLYVLGNGVTGTMPMQRGYGMGSMSTAADAANAVGGLGNLETIIAATIRAVTGQMGPLGSANDGTGGGLVRTSLGPSGPGPMSMAGGNMDMAGGGGGGGGYGSPAAIAGLGLGRWPGSPAVNMQSSAGSALSTVDDNTLYVGNVSFCSDTIYCTFIK